MQKWVVHSFDKVMPRASIVDFPPPVIPECLVNNGAQLLQFVKTPTGSTFGGGSSDARGDSGDDGRGGTIRKQPSNFSSGKKSRHFGA